jgi:D-amino peptidase
MKLYISADMEGVACVSDRAEVDKAEATEYAPARARMTAEVAAACEGGFAAGAVEIVVKDAHWTGRNLDAEQLVAPEGRSLRLVRGWSGHPFSMVQELDASFGALAFIGYHSAAGRAGNPLAHTLSSRKFARIEINEVAASEFLLFSYAAAMVNVPVRFLAGDVALCEEASGQVEGIVTVATMEGRGPSIVSLTPAESVRQIREGVARAVRERAGGVLALPPEFHVRATFTTAAEAYRRSFYPGAVLGSDIDVVFESRDYFDVLRFLGFMALG